MPQFIQIGNLWINRKYLALVEDQTRDRIGAAGVVAVPFLRLYLAIPSEPGRTKCIELEGDERNLFLEYLESLDALERACIYRSQAA